MKTPKIECTGTYSKRIDQYIVIENETGKEIYRGYNRANINRFMPKTHKVTTWVIPQK